MKGPVRVLVLSPVADLYGSSRSMLENLAHLDPGLAEFVWAIPSRGELADALEELSVRVEVIPDLRLARVSDSTPTRLAKLAGKAPRSAVKIARLARAASIDVIHSNSAAVLSGAYGSRLARVPHLWYVRELIPEGSPLARLLAREIPARSDQLVCVSSAVAKQFEPCDTPLEVLRSGIDWGRLGGITREAARAQLGLPADAVVVGASGYLNPRKGMDLLLEAYAEARSRAEGPTRLLLAGAPFPGNEQFADDLRGRARELGLGGELTTPGYLERIDLFLAAIDVFALTPREPEGLGRAVLEAMASEVPVLAIGEGGVLDIVEDESTGLLVAPGSPKAISASLGRLLADSALRTQLGQAGKRSVRGRFRVDYVAERLCSHYARLRRDGMR